jgi:hypothetical protein
VKDLVCVSSRISKIFGLFFATAALRVDFDIHLQRGVIPDLCIEFYGPDLGKLDADERQLFHALEHLACEIRGGRPELVSCEVIQKVN